MMSDLDKLVRVAVELEPDALAALLLLGERLIGGQNQYGRLDLASDPRDWDQEQLEEMADYVIYARFRELVSRRRRRGAKPPEPSTAPVDATTLTVVVDGTPTRCRHRPYLALDGSYRCVDCRATLSDDVHGVEPPRGGQS